MNPRLLLALLLGSCSASVNFIVIGDWGGMHTAPYSTDAQKLNALGMALVSQRIGAEFVIGLGDNFYNTGVSHEDAIMRFNRTFNEVYDQSDFKDLPWYQIAGNHDHYGNVTAQLELSNFSPRWKFPSLWYDEKFSWTEQSSSGDDGAGAPLSSASFTMHIIFIDTVVMTGVSPMPNKTHLFPQPHGPTDPSAAKEQFEWIEATLQTSTADFVWVVGHYPLYSACWQGGTVQLIERLKPLLDKYQAHYMSGHDHCQQHFVDRSSAQPVHYLQTGLGHGAFYGERVLQREVSTHSNVDSSQQEGDVASSAVPIISTMSQEDEALVDALDRMAFIQSFNHNPTNARAGFASVTAEGSGMRFSFHDQEGDTLYTSSIIQPRTF